jgi:F0F1-type ATP synthase assembly protein I
LSGSEFAGIGLQFAVTLVVFSLAGVWLDRKLGTSPWLTVALVFLGGGFGFWSMYRRVTAKQGTHDRDAGHG